jgi:hypothetical protein
MDTPKALLYGGVAAAVAVVQPELAPFILLGFGVLFFIFNI